MSDNLTRGAVSGFKWTYGAVAVNALMQVGYTAAMARLLTPVEFGLVAMATLFLRFGSYFANMGVGAALVQKPELSKVDVRAGFASGVGLGVVFSLVIVAAAPLASRLFANDQVVAVISVMSLTFILRGLGVTAHSLLRREMRFRTLAITDMASHIVGYMGVGLGFAIAGAGVWSLVAAFLGQAALGSGLTYAFMRHSVVPRFPLSQLGHLYAFGGRVSIIGFFEFLGNALDTVFIGRYVGAAPLGQYNRAQLLINLPLEKLTLGVTSVLFPAFSRIQNEQARLRRTYLSAIRFIAAFILPAAAGMAVAAPNLVEVVLGPQWGAAATVLPPLAAAATANYLSVLAAVTCEATGALNKKLLLQVGHLIAVGMLLSLSIGQPLVVYAGAIALAATLRFGGYLLIMRQVLALPFVEQVRPLGPVLVTSGIVGVALYGVGAGGSAVGATVTLVLAGQVLAGALIVLAALAFGPLVAVRQDARQRLLGAGLTGPQGGRFARSIDRLLGWRSSRGP